MSDLTLLTGNCLDILPTLADQSVQCVVTSPPYFGLRDYGTAAWDGGDAACDHLGQPLVSTKSTLRLDGREHLGPYDGEKNRTTGTPYRDQCAKCGARRVDQQLGLEKLHDCLSWARDGWFCEAGCYVCALRRVFEQLRRVLRDDGVVFLNLGDSYATNGATGPQGASGQRATRTFTAAGMPAKIGSGIKPKDLIGIPWRVALALQADGWWLRADCIWHKPNGMPSSVQDRPTLNHEYVFILAKSERYYWDAVAVAEPSTATENRGGAHKVQQLVPSDGAKNDGFGERWQPNGTRNLRSVWTIATSPFKGSHFAVFPPKLVERCILAGTSPQACEVCGAPWARVVERGAGFTDGLCNGCGQSRAKHKQGGKSAMRAQNWGKNADSTTMLDDGAVPCGAGTTTGWAPTCQCQGTTGAGRCTVLDPFSGSGTTLRVAVQHGRNAIGIDLNLDYEKLQRARTNGVQISMASLFTFDGAPVSYGTTDTDQSDYESGSPDQAWQTLDTGEYDEPAD